MSAAEDYNYSVRERLASLEKEALKLEKELQDDEEELDPFKKLGYEKKRLKRFQLDQVMSNLRANIIVAKMLGIR